MSSVPTARSSSAESLPAEFTHPALQDLLRRGRTNGFVDAGSVKHALEEAALPLKRMKAVLRTLDEHGVQVHLDAVPTGGASCSETNAATQLRDDFRSAGSGYD